MDRSRTENTRGKKHAASSFRICSLYEHCAAGKANQTGKNRDRRLFGGGVRMEAAERDENSK